MNIDATHSIPVSVSRSLLKRQLASFLVEDGISKRQKTAVMDHLPVQGLLVANSDHSLRLMEPQEAMKEFGLVQHTLTFDTTQQLTFCPNELNEKSLESKQITAHLFRDLCRWLAPVTVEMKEEVISARSLSVSVSSPLELHLHWSYIDEDLAATARSIIFDSLSSIQVKIVSPEAE